MPYFFELDFNLKVFNNLHSRFTGLSATDGAFTFFDLRFLSFVNLNSSISEGASIDERAICLQIFEVAKLTTNSLVKRIFVRESLYLLYEIDASSDAGETYENCPEDYIQTCGDGYYDHSGSDTSGNETDSCTADYITTLGDGVCDDSENPGIDAACTGSCGDGFYHHSGLDVPGDEEISCPSDYPADWDVSNIKIINHDLLLNEKIVAKLEGNDKYSEIIKQNNGKIIKTEDKMSKTIRNF